jgi:hypothetical protein
MGGGGIKKNNVASGKIPRIRELLEVLKEVSRNLKSKREAKI